jgi:formylglycine-generating enzyme required for sulfatase activity/protocatechuate 3,4-dioxygenase beta subunit
MFNPRSLRSAFILAIATMLAAGCDKAPEYEGDGPKMEFVRIPAGSFRMGSPASEVDRQDNEGPVHEVRITKPFYMGKYEVTQAQWKAVMGTTVHQQRAKAVIPWNLKGEGPEHPMYYVSWEEAVEFCKRLGHKFRLPTEAEWEYACRAGSRTRFHYGDDPNYSELDQYAWYYGKSDNRTHPVGQKKPNALSLYDMHGNVYEWCSDRYVFRRNYENAGSADPTGPASAKNLLRAIRGGSWLDKPNRCRSANREGFMQNVGMQSVGYDLIGFRVVFAGKVRGDSKVLEIALPQKTATVSATSDKESEGHPQTIAGVVRDEAGMPIGEVDMWIIPSRGLVLREYAEGWFELSWRPSDPNMRMKGYHFMAQNKQRNLAVGMEIEEDANELDIKLKTGVILTGKVVDSDGKGVEGATVVMTDLQTSDWSGRYLSWVNADAEGRFEFRALPLGYDYVLSARKVHYLVGQTEVRSENVRDNHIDGISIVLPRGKFSVSGVVVDAKGKPVPNVWVYCTGKGQAGINSHTDTDGRFKADGIFEGPVEIIANVKGDDGRWLSGGIDTTAGATDVRVVLGTGGAPPPKGRACFPADTNVWVDGEVVQISKVGLGQTVGKPECVLSTSPLGQIEKIEEHVGIFECRDIVLENGNRLSVVDAHCFMLESGRWIAAQDLRNGLRLKTLNGAVTIKNVTTRTTPFVGKVYNLRIKRSEQYMVGKDGVIVRDY